METTLYKIPCGWGVFSDCTSLTSVTIPDSVTTIGWTAFDGCTSLTSVTIPDSVTSIGYSAFSGCTSLTGIGVDDNNPNYSSDMYGVLFNKDKTVLIQAPGKIIEFIIPNSVTEIYEHAFYKCTSLTSVSIPDSVTKIGSDAFSGCISLTDVYYFGGVGQWSDIHIDSNNDPLHNATIHYNYAIPISHPAGDIDGNGQVENSDLVTIARYIVGLTEGDTKSAVEAYADMNSDGKVDNADIVTVARIIVGLA